MKYPFDLLFLSYMLCLFADITCDMHVWFYEYFTGQALVLSNAERVLPAAFRWGADRRVKGRMSQGWLALRSWLDTIPIEEVRILLLYPYCSIEFVLPTPSCLSFRCPFSLRLGTPISIPRWAQQGS